MRKNFKLAVVLMLPLIFCQHPNSPELSQNTDEPGYFSLTQLKGLQKVATISAENNTINLGDLPSTTNYYFLLTNCGGHVITQINLSVSDSSFTIFPSSIDSLTVGLGTQALVPIIKLTAIHGIGTQGIGYGPLMSKGPHQVHINISGKTKQNNVDKIASLTATATLNALVMDFDVSIGSKKVDLRNISGFTNGLTFDNNFMLTMVKMLQVPDNNISIVNTGNVDIKVKRENLDVTDSISSVIKINDSANFIIKDQEIFRFDGNNTVSDPYKLPKQADGNTYLLFSRN